MPGLYSHSTRRSSISESEYNVDHQNHITNRVPARIDDYSADVTEMQQSTDPGDVGSESLAGSLACEIERIRFVIAEMKGTTNWYETKNVMLGLGTKQIFLQSAAPTNWVYVGQAGDRILRTAAQATDGGTASGGTWFLNDLWLGTHTHGFGSIGISQYAHTAPVSTAGTGGGYGQTAGSHNHPFGGGVGTAGILLVTGDGAWRPLYVDAIICEKTAT